MFHEPQSPSSTELVTAILQEHGDRGWEDTIPREKSDSQGARNGEHRYLVDPEAESGSHTPGRQGTKNVRKIRLEPPEKGRRISWLKEFIPTLTWTQPCGTRK